MARHLRTLTGTDQHGLTYRVEYQPDWLYQVKVTRLLEGGRQSTKTLVRNPDVPEAPPGAKVRTRIVCEELGIDLTVEVVDVQDAAFRSTVELRVPGPDGEVIPIEFVIQRFDHLVQD